MSQQIFLPESTYKINPSMTYEELSAFHDSGIPVTGKVLRLNSRLRLFEVELGKELIGFMSFEESTIYPLSKSDGAISPNLYQLVGKTIRAQIIGFDTSNKSIFLSRKEHMLEALEFFKTGTDMVCASITSFSKLSAFFDIGAGIMGRAHTKDFATVAYCDAKDIGLKIGDVIPVKITCFLEEANKFDLSRVAALPSVFEVLSEGDVVIAKVFDPVCDDQKIGYFVLVDQKFNGIVDSPDIKLRYGDVITVFIKKIKENGNLKLTLVK